VSIASAETAGMRVRIGELWTWGAIPFGLRVMLIALILHLPMAAEPLDQGWQALNSGDWKEARHLFSQVEGLEGRLALARVELVLGRTEGALSLLGGQSIPELVMRMEVLYDAGQYTKATKCLRELEQLDHSNFPTPYDFHFYKTRGSLEKVASNFELAQKNLNEAARRAESPDHEALVLAERIWVWLDEEELEKASSAYSELEELIPQAKSVWTVARVLDAGFGVNRQKGDRTSAHAMKRAERELYRGWDNKVKAASTLIDIRNMASFKNNEPNRDLDLTLQAVEDFLDGEDWMRASVALGELSFVYPLKARTPEIERFVEAAVGRFPEGKWRDHARLSRAYFIFSQEAPDSVVRDAFTELTSSSSPTVRAYAYHGLARQAPKLGNYDAAILALEQSLALATPQRKQDREWSLSPGYALLEMSRLENRRRQYPKALKLARQAASSQNGRDWAWWRAEARQEGLTAALGMHDLEAAEAEFRAALKEIKTIPQVWFRSIALNSLTYSLINKSYEEDVLEPADLFFEEYDDVVHSLIQAVYSDPQELTYLLDTFDTWKEEAQRRQMTEVLGRASIQKGLILETLGRHSEARESFQTGLQTAQENDASGPQASAHLSLARLAALEGRLDEAADHATRASEIEKAANLNLARLYVLMAGGAQREAGRFSAALESYDFAIAQDQEKAWTGLFGRALTKEKMNQPQEALSDLEAALKLLEKSDFASTRATVLAAKARLLSILDRDAQALELFAQAFAQLQRLGTARHWPQVAMDYSTTLQKNSRNQDALKILTTAVDQLVDWQAPSFRNSQRLFQHTVALALELEDNKTALRYLQMSHSAEVLDSVDLADIETDAKTQALLKEVKGLKLRLNQLREESGESKQNDSLGQLLAATREDFFAKLAELRTKDPDFEALVSVSGSQLTSLQELLPPRSVLLEYFPAKNKLYIFAVSRDKFRIHEVALSRSELEALSRQHFSSLIKPGKSSLKQVQTAQRLRRVLLDPVGLDQFDSLRIVPGGPIWRIPLGTLLDDEGRPLHRKFEISYLTSSDILPIFRNHAAASKQPQSSVLVGGAPQLKGVAREVEQLKGLLPGARALTGEKLSLPAFRKLTEVSDLVHIASHSAVSPDTEKTYIQMGSEQLGLAQIYGLNLKPGALVVLSSCQTAVGSSTSPGKEVTSLASAFNIAGASTVIASRWKVDDGTTAEFFGFFYRALLSGKSRGEALRQAESDMAKLKPDPYYWAGFSLFGDPGDHK
jgi:CHAT domain-containing protein/tetratricopeptide (TPR) repeat protein